MRVWIGLKCAACIARLAQSVERWTLNPTVVGSSPTLGVPFDRYSKLTLMPAGRLSDDHTPSNRFFEKLYRRIDYIAFR